jgi:hypothetical protein
MTDSESQDILVIHHRPQVAVSVRMDGDLQIDVVGICPSFKNIEMNTVIIPDECIGDLIEALNTLKR